MITEFLVPEYEWCPENFEELKDIVAGPARVEFERTSLEDIEVDAERSTLVTPNGEYRLTQHVLERLAAGIDMPLAYAYKISADLFADNFAKQKYESTCPVTLCHVGNVATGLTFDKKSRYRPAPTLDVVSALQTSFKNFTLRRASVSFRGVDIELVQKTLVAEPIPGDVIEVGVAISNSESGGRHLKAEGYSFRLVCTNGARMGDSLGSARWPSDIRMTNAACMGAFERDVAALTNALNPVLKSYEVAAAEQVPDVELWNLWRRVAYGVSRDDADGILGLTIDERKALQESIKRRPYGDQPLITAFNAYEIHNRITHAAHGRPFLEHRSLQEIGGQFLMRAMRWPIEASVN